ncbi:HAMP domain-containing sensor histidine kinase [Myxococcaceae bacterium GXIMD 01537]
MWSGSTQEGVSGERAPGLLLLPRQGAPRLLGRALLEHLGLASLPPTAASVDALLTAAGFQPRPGASGLWEREGRVVRAGEVPLEDGGRLVWTWPASDEVEDTPRRVRYLSLASHDLRGPLANIRSYASLLLSGRVPLEPRVQRSVDTIARNADRALAFAQDFFDSSRADLGALAHEKERQPLEPLLANAVKRHQGAAEAASVALLLDPHPPTPDVEIDGGRIQHAVEAFILHHLTEAQPGEEIHVGTLTSPGGVRVEVRRVGAPSPDEASASIFQREERALREKKLEDPQRISLARQEVELHGGKVGVEADAGGTTLFLALPGRISEELAPSATMQP